MFFSDPDSYEAFKAGRRAADSKAQRERSLASGQAAAKLRAAAEENDRLRHLIATRDDYIQRLSVYAEELNQDRAQLQAWGEEKSQKLARLEAAHASLQAELTRVKSDAYYLTMDVLGLQSEINGLKQRLGE